MADKIGFKSYCWAIGTTSFRAQKMNESIEQQLKLIKEFRELPENSNIEWTGNNDFQAAYYDFLKKKDFVKGDAPRPDKDAREKTSGLCDIGLIDNARNITNAGKALLDIIEKEEFSTDNLLQLSNDSYLYFKQMLKTTIDVEDKAVRPFVVFLYVINEMKYLSYDEFTYLLPLCIDRNTTDNVIESIIKSRKGLLSFDEAILSVLMNMPNYKAALQQLQTEPITEELICNIGINRKSGIYDKPYYQIYTLLKNIVFDNANVALELYEATLKLKNNKVGGAWRKYLFSSTARSVIKREGLSVLNEVPILHTKNDKEFNDEFFKIMHIFKVKATLSDYFDLNRRYFKITDTVIFEDGKVRLDILPQCYAEQISEKLLDVAFEKSQILYENADLYAINPFFDVTSDVLYSKLGQVLGKKVTDKVSAQRVIRDERYERFNKLIDERFNKDKIIELLEYFETRQDDEIRRIITDNADVPTMFEYVLGIAWYIISDRQGDVLEYMNLSLEADLLPKTHAGGGEADIVWKYEKTEMYPKHTLLIEATLADGTNQRRMEMEPVSRHLGDYCLTNPDDEAYCVFITTYLNTNVISDFRARRFMEYYNAAGTDYITGMKILPLQTSELKTLLRFEVRYSQIYKMLDKAYNSSEAPKEWYENNIVRETGFYNGEEV